MNGSSEAVLGTLSSGVDNGRTLVVHCHHPDRGSWMELRQQSRGGSSLGWFTQSSLRLETQQIAQLRNVMARTRISGTLRQVDNTAGGFVPRVIHADSA
ncbi:MAG: hypothetical protein CMJ81_20140 [Planctomycetaceae bacterium]|nr:hypothetical protein [Planctomycetaceae bacterium]MBP62600.1 hypothetical protein [Planctomycetaceae bacterium]